MLTDRFEQPSRTNDIVCPLFLQCGYFDIIWERPQGLFNNGDTGYLEGGGGAGYKLLSPITFVSLAAFSVWTILPPWALTSCSISALVFFSGAIESDMTSAADNQLALKMKPSR